MTSDMYKKAVSKKVIAIDPLKPNFNEDELLKDKIIKDVLSTGGIDPTKGDFLSVNAEKEATDKLDA